MKEAINEVTKFDDIFHSHGCLLNETSSFEDFKAVYAAALEFAQKENRLEELLQWKLEEVTGFCGTHNHDFTDFISVMKLNKEMWERVRSEPRGGNAPLPKPDHLAKILNFPQYYVNLIYCVLDSNGCMNYGINLQCGWLEDLGLELLQPELGPKFSEFFKEKNSLN